MAKTVAPRQTSKKSGVVSSSKKMNNTRYGFQMHPASRKVEGAFGAESGSTPVKRQPGTESTRAGKAAALRRVKHR